MPPLKEDAGTDLVSAALRVILEIARDLRTDADDGELRGFYAELMAYCVLINNHLSRIIMDKTRLAYDLVDSITARLGAILILKGTVEERLRELVDRWGKVRAEDNTVKAQFIGSSLAFGDTNDQRVALIDFLTSWESDVRRQYPEERSSWTAEDVAPQKKIGEPPFSVWNSAQAVFKAMTSCQDCGCTPEHDFGARLCIGTYRKSGTDDDNEGKVDFDMFLSATQDWQEVRVHTAKERAIHFEIDAKAPPRQPRISGARVKRLCVPIIRAKRMMTVELKVTQGRLLWLPSERSKRLEDLTKSPVSLHEFLKGHPRAFTGKTRRILSVLLSYAVLHLQDTPWLQPTWSSSDILFFRTMDSEIPLRPFLQTRLSGTQIPGLGVDDDAELNPSGEEDGLDYDDIDPDDQMQHPCPTILTLAIMLMETYFAMPFQDIAMRLNHEVARDSPFLTKYLVAIDILEAYRDEMPDLFLYAVDKCLDRAIWEDEEGIRLDSHTLRSRIYEEVVRPLENDLLLGYSSISIEDLDRFARELDFSNWDQAIRDKHSQVQDSQNYPQPHGETPIPFNRLESPAPGPTFPLFSQHSPIPIFSPPNSHLGMYKERNECSLMLEVPPRLVSSTLDPADYKAAKFFDDEVPRNGNSPEA